MNKICEEWRRKWDMGITKHMMGESPKRKLNKWSRFRIFRYAREEHSIKQRFAMSYDRGPRGSHSWIGGIISRPRPQLWAALSQFPITSRSSSIYSSPTLKINKQIKHTFLRSYPLVWKIPGFKISTANVFLQLQIYSDCSLCCMMHLSLAYTQ